MPVDDETLSKLLRLKRFEQPPAGYHENFLREFQARQRAELLRRPIWRIALDRLETFREEYFTAHRLAYASASAAVLAVAGALTFNMLQHPGSDVRDSMANVINRGPGLAMQPVSYPAASATRPALGNALTPHIRIPDALMESSYTPTGGNGQPPRYILDTRPASYEPPFSF